MAEETLPPPVAMLLPQLAERTTMEPKKTFWDYLDEDAPLTEESVWQAIADAEGVDYSEIADGDLAEWL